MLCSTTVTRDFPQPFSSVSFKWRLLSPDESMCDVARLANVLKLPKVLRPVAVLLRKDTSITSQAVDHTGVRVRGRFATYYSGQPYNGNRKRNLPPRLPREANLTELVAVVAHQTSPSLMAQLWQTRTTGCFWPFAYASVLPHLYPQELGLYQVVG